MSPYYDLIQAYKYYLKFFYEFASWEEKNEYWIQVIGGRQYKLPMIGLFWFCDPTPFDPVPTFTNSPIRSSIVENINLAPLEKSELGKRFYLDKCTNISRSCKAWGTGYRGTRACEAMVELYTKKTIELNAIILELSLELSNDIIYAKKICY